MAITLADFNKIWASTSPLTPYSFSASHYKEGWNFIGSTPPSRQMWDFLQKNNDEKMQYLANNYLPLSGGTMTGVLTNNGSTSIPINIKTTGTDYRDIQIESSDGNHRIAAIRASKTSEGRCEITIGASTTSNAAPIGITISRSTTNIYATAPTPDATDNSQKIATTGFVRTIVPAGVVLAYARGAVPTGWLLCDGSAVSRTDYAALYAVIGTTYGAGNGSTTFNLPNLVDKFVEGSATAGTVKSAGLPNITGSIGGGWGSGGPAGNGSGIGFLRDSLINGCFRPNDKAYGNETGTGGGTLPSGDPVMTANLDASRSNPIYGKSDTVQPPALTMRYIIKY